MNKILATNNEAGKTLIRNTINQVIDIMGTPIKQYRVSNNTMILEYDNIDVKVDYPWNELIEIGIIDRNNGCFIVWTEDIDRALKCLASYAAA